MTEAQIIWGLASIATVLLLGLLAQIGGGVRDITKTNLELSLWAQRHDFRFESLQAKLVGHDQRFDRIDERFVGHDQRFDRIDERLVGHDQRFDRIDERLVEHDQRFDRIDERLVEHDQRFDRIDERFVEHDQRFDRIDERFVDLRTLGEGLGAQIYALAKKMDDHIRWHAS
jgi:hypothetical protein